MRSELLVMLRACLNHVVAWLRHADAAEVLLELGLEVRARGIARRTLDVVAEPPAAPARGAADDLVGDAPVDVLARAVAAPVEARPEVRAPGIASDSEED